MQLKSRHLLLFMIACGLLIYADTPGGALIAMAALMQLLVLLHNFELTRKSQLLAFKLFLVSIPLLLFWGAIHSFTLIYFKEAQYLFFGMALSMTLALSFLINLQLVFSYSFMKDCDFIMTSTLQSAFNNIKNRKTDFFRSFFLVFIFSFVPGFNTDWKLVFAVMATHLYLNRLQVKKALADF